MAKKAAKRVRRTNDQVFLDKLKDLITAEQEFVASAELKNELEWDAEKYARIRLQLIKSNKIVSKHGGPGGMLSLSKNLQREPLSIFISYSHQDNEYLKGLKKHMAILERLELVKSWVDQEIKAGDHWDEKISDKMANADICLLLVSADFISSKYCYEVELDSALDREAKKEVRVIPVILRSCLWKESRIGHLQALPPEGKPISSWDDIDSALTAVAKGILDIANEIINSR